MKNWKIIIPIVLIGIGGLFELLQSFGDATDRQSDKISAREIKDFDVRPFVSSHKAQAVQQKQKGHSQRVRSWKKSAPKVAKLKTAPQVHDFGHKATKKKTQAKKKKDKKKDKKKNKKDKKETDGETSEDTEVAEYEESEKNEDKKRNEEVAPETTALAGAPAPIDETNKNLPLGYEEWAKLVLANPDFAATQKLIQYYHNAMISAELYFQLVSEMTLDDREKMVILGVGAAGAAPHHKSFDILAKVIRDKRQGSVPHKKAVNHIQTTYIQYNNVKHLRTVIVGNETPYTVVLATQSLSASAESNLQPVTIQPAGTEPDEVETLEEQQAKQAEAEEKLKTKAKIYLAATFELKELISSSSNSSVTGAAQQALDSITQVLENIGVDTSSQTLAQNKFNGDFE